MWSFEFQVFLRPMDRDNKKVRSRICPLSILALVVVGLSTPAARADMGLAIFFLMIAGAIGLVSYIRIRNSEGRLRGKIPAGIAIAIALALIGLLVWTIIDYKLSG